MDRGSPTQGYRAVRYAGCQACRRVERHRDKDKDGVVHDLAELVKSGCVIDTGIALHMAVHDYYTCINKWTSSGGFSHSSERLAKLIREHADDPDVRITVHKF